MSENKVNMSLDEIIKLNRKENQQTKGARNGQSTSARGVKSGGVFARAGRGGRGMARGRANGVRGAGIGSRFGGQTRGNAGPSFRGSQLNLRSQSLSSVGVGRTKNMLNIMVKKAVRRALATSNQQARPALGVNRGLPIRGRGILRRVGGRGAFAGATRGLLNRIQTKSRTIQRIRPAARQILVQQQPKIIRRFARIQSPERAIGTVIRRPARQQQIFRQQQQPRQQVIVRRRIIQQVPQPQQQQRVVIRKRFVQRQPQQQIFERQIPRQQVIRRPAQQVIQRVQRVIQRPQIQYVQERPQVTRRIMNGGGQGRFQRVVEVPRLGGYQQRVVIRRRGGRF